MNDPILLYLKKFLQERDVQEKTLLLGYSGGPDSKALLHLLNQCRSRLEFELCVVHVDHSWRDESGKEAAELGEEVAKLGLKFYLQKLNPELFKNGNCEKLGREARFQIFSEVYHSLNCCALILGHHADDQAEVVLKRVCEGASFFSLKSLGLENPIFTMNVWRPLLPFFKREILQWLRDRELSFFEDPTNLSDRFLRGRMRTEMLPFLEKSFGKQIVSNFCHLASEAREIADYFSQVNQPLFQSISRSDIACSLDLKPFLPLPQVQLKHFFKEWMAQESVTISKKTLTDLLIGISKSSSEKKFHLNKALLYLKKGTVFLLKNKTSE